MHTLMCICMSLGGVSSGVMALTNEQLQSLTQSGLLSVGVQTGSLLNNLQVSALNNVQLLNNAQVAVNLLGSGPIVQAKTLGHQGRFHVLQQAAQQNNTFYILSVAGSPSNVTSAFQTLTGPSGLKLNGTSNATSASTSASSSTGAAKPAAASSTGRA
jgi:hypothetical protein